MASLLDNSAHVLDLTAYRSTLLQPAEGTLRSLLTALDALNHCFAFHDRMGRLQHASRTLLNELERDDDADSVRRQVSQFVQMISGHAAAARWGAAVQQFGARSASSGRGVYQLHGTYIGIELFGNGPSVLVSITPPASDPCAREQLARRFDLTRAQAKVARLLAQGLRNDEIAQQLFLSVHTVRHHIEQIRVKTGGHTRAAVAAKLRGEA